LSEPWQPWGWALRVVSGSHDRWVGGGAADLDDAITQTEDAWRELNASGEDYDPSTCRGLILTKEADAPLLNTLLHMGFRGKAVESHPKVFADVALPPEDS
jgi:hypothetical protein